LFAPCPYRSKQLKLFQCKVYIYICNSIEWSSRECFKFDVASMISFIVRAMLVLVMA
jgi:hypothetical protein